MYQLKGFSLEQQVSDAFDMPTQQAHPQIEIYYLFRGSRRYFIETSAYQIEPGCIVFINSYRIHKTSSADELPHERLLLEVDPSYLQQWKLHFPSLSLAPLEQRVCLVCQLKGKERAEMEHLLLSMQQLCESRPEAYAEELSARLFLVLLSLLRLAQTNPDEGLVYSDKHLKVHEIAEYITRKAYSPESLDKLAERFFINKFYMCHIFKEITGMSILTFLNTARIRKACLLLTTTDKPVTWIAQETGYESASRFSRTFKKEVGMTPREYRKALGPRKIKKR